VRRRAHDQIAAIARSLERERRGYGALFIDAVAGVLRLIEELPESFPSVPARPGVHKGVLASPFNTFVVYFEVGERETTILALLHGARHPDAWKR
jgi:plasmid stabilization system protein ParE